MKKFTALFLVISFLVMNCATYKRGAGVGLEPDQKPGAELVVTKKDGQSRKGELIAVKNSSLLLLSESGIDVSIDVNDIREIKIVKKSRALAGFGLGLLIGSVPLIIATATDADLFYGGVGPVFIAIIIGPIAGFGFSKSAGRDETIQIEGKSDAEIKEILEDLRSKARVRDFQ